MSEWPENWAEGGSGQTALPYPVYVDIVTKRYFDGVDNKTMDQINADFMLHQDFERLNREMAALMTIYMGGSNKSKENEEKEADEKDPK